MSAGIIIRSVTTADVDAFRRLRLEALRLHPVAFTADLAEAEARPVDDAWRRQVEAAGGEGSGVIMVAEVDGGGEGELAVRVAMCPRSVATTAAAAA